MSNPRERPDRRASAGEPAEGAVSHPRDKQFSVRKLGHAQHRVALTGTMRPGFMALLSARLSDQCISIQRAHAYRTVDGRWHAELDLLRLEGGVDPQSLHYGELADTEGFLQTGPLTLTHFEIADDARHGGCLRLDVEAPDSLGFLARLLSLLSMLVLFPVELTIETVDGRVRDTLLLARMGGLRPGPDVHHMLHGLLTKALAGR